MGPAIVHVVGRHVHPAAKTPAPTPAPVTGIDYLNLVRQRHTTALTEHVNYAAITERERLGDDRSDHVLPGQTDLLDLIEPSTNDTTDQTHDLQEQK